MFKKKKMIKYKLDTWKQWEKRYFLRKSLCQGTFHVAMFGTTDENVYPEYYQVLGVVPLEVEHVDTYQKHFHALTTEENLFAHMNMHIQKFFQNSFQMPNNVKTRYREMENHRLLIYINTHCWWISRKKETGDEIKITPEIYIPMLKMVQNGIEMFEKELLLIDKEKRVNYQLIFHFQTCFHPQQCRKTENDLLKYIEKVPWCWIILHRDTTENEGSLFFDIELHKRLPTQISIEQCVDFASQRAFGYPGATLLHQNEKNIYQYFHDEPEKTNSKKKAKWSHGNFQ